MRTILRPFTIALSAAFSLALVVLGILPAQAAAPQAVAFTVWDGGSSEYYKSCADTPPYPCGTYNHSMYLQITGPWPPRSRPITLGYQITDITTTAGLDYTYPTTGTVVIPAGQYVTSLNIPMVIDGVAEPAETFRVRLTSSSIGGNISDTGIGRIDNDGMIPPDCDLSQSDAFTVAMACTGRPAGQQWWQIAFCGDEWPMVENAYGNVVTGSGTSTAQCPHYPNRDSSFYLV